MDKCHVDQKVLSTIPCFLTESDCTCFAIQDINIFLEELWESEHVFTRSHFIYSNTCLLALFLQVKQKFQLISEKHAQE